MHRAICLALTTAAVLNLAAGSARAADAMPFKLFDAHVHLISGDTQRYPKEAPGPPPAGASPAGGGLPAGVGGQRSANSGTSERVEPTAEQILRAMDEEGVEAAAAVQKKAAYGYDNSYILDSTDQNRERLIPVVVLDAADSKTPELLRELVKTRGVAGIRLTGAPAKDGSFPWLGSPQAQKTWAVAEQAGLVMDLMPLYPGKSPEVIAEIIKLADAHPHVRVVLDHLAWPDTIGAPEYGIDALHRTLASHKNIFYKITTINLDLLRESRLPDAEFVRRVVDVYGADHVMWGSDIGNSAGTYAELVGRIVAATSKLRESERRAVLHDTGHEVFVRGGMSARRSVSLDNARDAATAALEACRKSGYQVTVTVLNRAGHTASILHDDGADLRSLQNSQRKAATSLAFSLPSGEYGKRMTANPGSASAFDADKFSVSNGGLPILAGVEVVGSIGVSGAPGGDKDLACAQAGIDRITKKLS